jgi:uncharacterized membrane protein YphA (DoxX/SURF4 family)
MPSPPRGPEGPPPWVRPTVAVLLRLGLGVSLLNGGLLGYLSAHRGISAPGLAWSTLLGPAAAAGALQHDALVPLVQIGLGMALILGFFTSVSAAGAGLLILSGPIFQFLAILGNSGASGDGADLQMQALVSSGTTNLLLLVAALLWLTPGDGTPWSLDALIFAHRRAEPDPPPRPRPAPSPAPADGARAVDDPTGPATASPAPARTAPPRDEA